MVERIFVEQLPDLIEAEEYASDPKGKRVRLRIYHGEAGVELLGDAMRAQVLEKILIGLEPKSIEQMLCG